MAKVIQTTDFFVVGGPVQPDRPCYVERAADRALEGSILARRFSLVLGSRAIGKSSAMARCARRLRDAEELCALVDLAQIDARGDAADADRWAYAIASKIAHELRLKIDLTSWWREQAALLGERPLAEFFREVVLANTTVPVTIFVDEIERTLDMPFAAELYAAIEACYVRRAAERDYSRLTFVLVGVVAPQQLDDAARAPLPRAQSIDLADFTPEESYRLALGFGGEPAQAQALMDRICAWTGGHPYLTQKVARAVSRKGGKLEDVEHVVREQLIAPFAARGDALLGQIATALTARTAPARSALRLLGRLAKGGKPAPSDAGAAQTLLLTGVVVADAQGVLRYRNRIFREVFGPRWVSARLPRGWRRVLAAAAVLALLAVGANWYVHELPRPYLATLTTAGAPPEAVDEAYARLSRLPGFEERAERLYAAALERRSRAATSFAAAAASDAALRALDANALADRLLGEFWLRKAEDAARKERRDSALLYAARSTAAQGGTGMLAELASADYPLLDRTLRMAIPPPHWSVDWEHETLLSVDAGNNLQRARLSAESVGSIDSSIAIAVRLTALKAAAVSRDLQVAGDGSAGDFELTATIAHPASAELLLKLSAPSGVEASVPVPQGAPVETFVFTAAAGSPLAALADEERRGRWRLEVIDRRSGNVGSLVGWGLRFDEQIWRDDPDQSVAIPDPERTDDVVAALPSGATFAVVRPSMPGPIGTIALWDLASGRLLRDFTLPRPPREVVIDSSAARLLAVSGNVLTLWDAADGAVLARVTTQTDFVMPPIFSSGGGYLMIAERVEDGPPLYSLLSAKDGSLLGSVEGQRNASDWWLGPGARYLALQDTPNTVRLVDPRRGTEIARLQHPHALRRVLPLPDGKALLTIDALGEIRLWPIDASDGSSEVATYLGTTADADSVSIAANGARLAYSAADGAVLVLELPTGRPVQYVRLEGGAPGVRTELAPDADRLVTSINGQFRHWKVRTEPPSIAWQADGDVSAVAVAAQPDATVIGTHGGQLRAASGANLERPMLSFFGHRGDILAVAVDARHGVAASGGSDGTARIWDLATAAPAGPPLALNVGRRVPVTVVALAPDGRSLAAATDATVVVWQLPDSTPVAQWPMAATTALAFSADSELLATGTRNGDIAVAPRSGGSTQTLPGNAAIESIAFAPNANVLATGDAAGGLRLLRLADGSAVGQSQGLPEPVRWIGFSSDGAVLCAATDHWLHSYGVTAAGLVPMHARLSRLRFAPGAPFAMIGPERVRVAGFDENGELGVDSLDLAATASGASDPALASRDWTVALGLRLAEDGSPVTAGP